MLGCWCGGVRMPDCALSAGGPAGLGCVAEACGRGWKLPMLRVGGGQVTQPRTVALRAACKCPCQETRWWGCEGA